MPQERKPQKAKFNPKAKKNRVSGTIGETQMTQHNQNAQQPANQQAATQNQGQQSQPQAQGQTQAQAQQQMGAAPHAQAQGQSRDAIDLGAITGLIGLLGKDVIMRLIMSALDRYLPRQQMSPQDQQAVDQVRDMLQKSQQG